MQIAIATINWPALLFFVIVLGLISALILVKPIMRYIIKVITNDAVKRLLTDDYTQNVAETLSSLKRFSVINFIEMSLRAQSGKVLTRPLGSPKHFLGYDQLMFSPRQMTQLSLPESAQIDMSVTIGSNAEKPLKIKIPLMIGAMAYGLALSEEAKLALARASKKLQTATNSGEGPFLPEEPGEAGKFVLQICRWSWGGRTNEQITSADMLEVQMGQGSDTGVATIEASEIVGRARILGGLEPGELAVALNAPPGVQKPEDWPAFMKKLRQRAKGIPIALKIMATGRLEEELSTARDLGFDVIVIDGVEGGSHATAPIKQDDFGIPSLLALIKAKRFLQGSSISIVIAGGYFTPGQCLKALALGADAIYLATVPLFALGHNQLEKVIPWEPPTTLVYYNSPTKTQLNINQAATSVENVMTSMVLEMEEAMRALGKASLKELSADDLIALDSLSAEITGVRSVLQEPVPPISNQTLQKLKKQLSQSESRITLKDLAVARNEAVNHESNTVLDESLIKEHLQLIRELKEENKLMWKVIDTYIKSPHNKKIGSAVQKKKHLIAKYKNCK
ncbi:FMN-binding glutamate synthase family protein [Pelosinus propionicus]|uniref:Glutamate synthase domain-containing protein 2 n=1 Tax=Pelosinus propionicus DSM 13327 TaxID=1123291 RepID=A0A1I4LZA1_9FIRM|nr:FMN-binding glutamate synthase family protein [Pelosinus propionicus]SFL96331.1 Glutamate synthase domain-containing protein 2 [Pelosinus propionicus DSM 13327]